ncbi:hypothetical protein B7Z00_00325 [Candidatus Saccharibacteria bacterium 32-50-10]|nr:MAG: hypothetical protein B7Z00_00325 [Candidatus Saccharibacteria bacterium 32-50-10]
MNISKNIFRTKLAFEPVDPLDDGLREMIERERQEAESIDLRDNDFDAHLWSEVSHDIHS